MANRSVDSPRDAPRTDDADPLASELIRLDEALGDRELGALEEQWEPMFVPERDMAPRPPLSGGFRLPLIGVLLVTGMGLMWVLSDTDDLAWGPVTHQDAATTGTPHVAPVDRPHAATTAPRDSARRSEEVHTPNELASAPRQGKSQRASDRVQAGRLPSAREQGRERMEAMPRERVTAESREPRRMVPSEPAAPSASSPPRPVTPEAAPGSIRQNAATAEPAPDSPPPSVAPLGQETPVTMVSATRIEPAQSGNSAPSSGAPQDGIVASSVAPLPATIPSTSRRNTPDATAAVAAAVPARHGADEQEINDTLRRYAAAYDHLDARAAQTVWPSVDERALARAFQGLESQDITFNQCDVMVSQPQGSASAACLGSATYVPRIGNKDARTEQRRWTFQLQKVQDAWVITKAATR